MGRPTKSPATPSTLTPTPSTLTPTPSTLTPTPSTLTPTPSPRPPPTNSGPTRTPIPHTDHTCPTCSKSFCGFQGWQYHTINKVCALRPSDRPPPLPKPTSCQRNSTCNKGYRHQGNCLGVDPSTGAGCSTKESVEKEFPEGWTIMKQGPNWMIKAPKSGAIYRSIRAARESLALIQRFFGQHREGKLDRNELDASTDRESDSTPTLRALYCRISGGKKGSGGQPGKHGKDGNNWMIRDELLDAIMLLPVLPSSSRSSSSIDDNTPASPPPKRRKKIDDDNRKRMDWSFDACLDAFGPEEIEGQEAIRIDLDEEEEEGGAKKASGRTTWRTCGVVGCEYWTKNESNLKGHIAVMHATNVLYLFCDCEGCEYKTKNEKNLKQHRVDVHAIHETNWVFCDYEGCEFRAKSNGRITQHKARKHNIDVKWHHCTECEFKAKTTGHITNHKASIHNIGVKWHQCTHCDHKTKLSSNLTIHMAGVHNIGVKWHHCPDCDYKAKQIGNLKVHIKSKHTTTT